MSLNVVKKGVLGKDKFFYQAIELLLQPEDRDAGDESEAKLREMLKENLQAQHKHKASAGPGRPATAAASRPGTHHTKSLTPPLRFVTSCKQMLRSWRTIRPGEAIVHAFVFARGTRAGKAVSSAAGQAQAAGDSVDALHQPCLALLDENCQARFVQHVPRATPTAVPLTSLASHHYTEGGGLVKHEAEQTEEEVVESRDSPEEDDRVRTRTALQSLSCRSTHVTTCADPHSSSLYLLHRRSESMRTISSSNKHSTEPRKGRRRVTRSRRAVLHSHRRATTPLAPLLRARRPPRRCRPTRRRWYVVLTLCSRLKSATYVLVCHQLGKSAEGMVHALHNRDLKIKKKLKEVKKAREARSVRPTFNK